ncbi:toll/interleukin-1 receptor domain-containing protein [Roseomonas sp. GCM10028921]
MADVCIFYARLDEAFAERLHAMLSARWNVWWDRDIVGPFAEAIEREASSTTCCVPIWSKNARGNPNVGDELRLARESGRPIIPVRIDDSQPPYGYGDLSSVDLRGWSGETDHPGIRQLVHRISLLVSPRRRPTRPESLASGRLELPALFLSVSSYETRLPPLDALRALRLFGADALLVSAYDLAVARRSDEMVEELALFREQGGFVLVDSGNYEAYRMQDKDWCPAQLAEALSGVPRDWLCSFDVMTPPSDPSEAIECVVAAVGRDQTQSGTEVVPIIHAGKTCDGNHDPSGLPAVIRAVAEHLAPPMIAVPERELGPGIIERARTVRRIRAELDSLPIYQPLHLLGTGNPWSIAVLAAAGADSFDGLEWCRIAVDAKTGTLHHIQHFDFFAWQASSALSPITQAAVGDARVDYTGKVAFHNLEYFRTFCRKLREHSRSHKMEVFITGLLGSDNKDELTRQMPELFA